MLYTQLFCDLKARFNVRNKVLHFTLC